MHRDTLDAVRVADQEERAHAHRVVVFLGAKSLEAARWSREQRAASKVLAPERRAG
jgi:hypothetical protein